MKIQKVRRQESGVRREKSMQYTGFSMQFFLFCLLLTAYCLLFFITPSHALTVQEVAVDLACPCECPLVLEDCNMSCGLDWKDQIGQMISQGKTKEEIIKHFIDKYGDAARITPLQRIQGKIFKYTRAFGAWDWVMAGTVAVIWIIGMFLGVYLITRRLLLKHAPDRGQGKGAK